MDDDNVEPDTNDVEVSSEPDQIEKPEKKKPGRPRKKQPIQPKKKKGVVLSPEDAMHHIEFLYDRPLIFKKLWQFFKLMSVDKIHMAFTKNNIIIYCTDHHKKSRVRVNIDCSKVNHYYCEKDLDIGLLCKNPELIMSTIDKTYSSILFLSTKDNIQKNIQIVLKNEIEIDETHKIELIPLSGEYNKSNDESDFLDEDYMIKFKLSGKYFKKMISDIKSFSEQITIRKDGPEDNLIFEYTANSKKIKSMHIIKNNDSISLRDNLGPDDTFRTSFKIDYVKSISSALLNETIEIYSDENKPLKFMVQMDDAISITILTTIIDQRDPPPK